MCRVAVVCLPAWVSRLAQVCRLWEPGEAVEYGLLTIEVRVAQGAAQRGWQLFARELGIDVFQVGGRL